MLGFILIVAIAVAIAWYVINDMNKPLAEKISTAAKKVEAKVQDVADVNNDGKVTVADAKEVVTKAKRAVKKTTKTTRKKKAE